MDRPEAAFKTMVDEKHRNVLGTFNPRMIACARRSIIRARALEIPEKEELVLDFLMMTAGLDGRGREDLRDALMGAKTPQIALAGMAAPTQGDRHGGVPGL